MSPYDVATWNVLSLFSGIGGLELGLERSGMTTVGQVEIDPFCRSVLARHWPDVPRHDDVRTAGKWWASEQRPVVDVVAGGYPCQSESLAGKRQGTADARWLWPEMARVIHTLKPRWVIGENTSGHRTRGLRFVLRDLERLGYTARAGTIRACDLGAPHQRERIFVLAHLAGIGAAQPSEEPQPPHDATGTGQRAHPRSGVDGRGDVHAHLDGAGQLAGGGLGPTGQTAERTAWWSVEPNVVRVVHGVPGRVDRIRGLGNAVVPQVAEHIGRIVIDTDHAFREVRRA
jgi:DNA (cytosine-5)-methyltransferase 1